MSFVRTILLAGALATLPACLATKVAMVPVGLAVGAAEVAGKGVILVGGTADRVTGDALDGPDERVNLDVTMKSGKHIRKTIKKKNLERELKTLGKKGKIVDVEVSPVS